MWESRGKITQIQGEDMHYDLSTTGGNSGSPVFNSRNEVIGIHWVAQLIAIMALSLSTTMFKTS